MRNSFIILVASLILVTLCDGASACRIFRRYCPAPAPVIVESAQSESSESKLAKLLANLTPQALEALEKSRPWPGGSSLESLSANTVVVAATAAGPVKLGKSYSAHISTQMSIGDQVIHGGGMTTSTKCSQEFQITEVLHGKAKLEKRIVNYVIMDSRAFPGPQSTGPVPTDAKAILLFDESGYFLKAIPDDAANRQAVKDALSRKKEASK